MMVSRGQRPVAVKRVVPIETAAGQHIDAPYMHDAALHERSRDMRDIIPRDISRRVLKPR